MGQMTFKCDDKFRDMIRYCSLREPQGAYETRLKPETKVCLWLVHDQGVYLMPGIKNGGKAEFVIFARGTDPDKHPETWWDRARDLVGGDDFAESVELSPEIVDEMLAGITLKLEIKFTETSMTVATYKKRVAA